MAEQDEIYLYLPSSVESKFVSNAVSHYTTSLGTPIQMSNSFDYEVALVKMLYSSSVNNVYYGPMNYYSFVQKMIVHTKIATGMYPTPDDLVKAFNEALMHDAEYYELTVDYHSRKFLLHCKSGDGKTTPRIEFSENLQTVMSFPKVISKVGYETSEHSYDMFGGLAHMYCYCDIVRNVNIGDTLAPLLSVVNYNPGRTENHAAYEPKHMVYVPVSKTFFDHISVEIRTKTGVFYPFASGETMLLIHVRPRLPR